WSKNVFLFAGIVFAQKLGDLTSVQNAILGFLAFCLLSSTVYEVNDMRDREEDKLHPKKRNRPIASGQVSVQSAMSLAIGLCIVALLASYFLLDVKFFIVAVAYLILQALYIFWLKQQVLIDVIVIGLGFVLRAIAGAVAVHAVISPWLVTCTFTLCLFMGFSKRRCELNALSGNGDAARTHRKTLGLYTPELLNHMTTLAAGIAVVSFMLYAMDDRTLKNFGTNYLIYTLPIVVYAIFRFAFLVEHGLVSGPTEVMINDRPFQAALVLWLIAVIVIINKGLTIHEWLSQNSPHTLSQTPL
ncbi:MAG: decaprenyl-phosphate phosphoribosyltransferase, partial [Phycisphaerae bacterium]